MFHIDEVLYMVTIQPLKQQYLTALKERQQIINKLNEIITGLNGIDFDDLTNIHTELITIRESIEQIDTEITDIEAHLNEFEQETEVDLQSKVNKSGDTMTGNLSIPLTGTGTRNSYAVNGERLQNDLDNYDFMVRTSGNQIIGGAKTFTSSPYLSGGQLGYMVKRTDMAIGESWTRYRWDRVKDKNDKDVMELACINDENNTYTKLASHNYVNGNDVVGEIRVYVNADGTVYATSPTTLNNAISNEIATANWVISKINEFATANNLQVIQ